MRRRGLVSVLATLVLAAGGCGVDGAAPRDPVPDPSAADPSAAAPARTTLVAGEDAWVAVSVSTLWRSPSSPRAVDAPALEAPVRVRAWLSAMSTEQRRGLNGRADTQAILGDRVRVLRLDGGWARVRVPDQPVPGVSGGYRGWVPRRQLTARPPTRTTRLATVTSRTSWVHDPGTGARRLLVSYGTRLPWLRAQDDSHALVTLPSGARVTVPSANVSVHLRGEPALARTGRSLVRSARQFVGLDYLWAGRSGFGFDCSGLTSLDYRVHGLVIPRDARPQSVAGRAVAAGHLARGDLLFYATDGVVHHVSMYAGDGTMVHAPGTGRQVEVIATSTPAYSREYAGARRFLPPR